MNATSLYVTTSRLVFQNEYGTTDQNWTDLYRLVPYLRQSLSCLVCGKLLTEPHKPSDGRCQHHICRKCVSGRKNLKPSCIYCRDNFNSELYEENTQMRILIQCYKYLCQYIMNTPIFKLNINNSGGMLNGSDALKATLLQFIEEGANFTDNFKANSGLTKSAYSILPCVFSPPPPTTISPISSSPQTTTQSPSPIIQQQQVFQTTQHLQSPTLILQQQQPQQQTFQQQQVIQIHQPSGIYQKKVIQTQHQPPPLTLVNNAVCLSPTTTTVLNNVGTSTTSQQIQTVNAIGTISNQKPLITHHQIQNNVINIAPKISISTNANMLNQNDQRPIVSNMSTVQIRNPPPIKTVSNGSAMYSVLYTGIGNKITIKRKTDGDDDSKKTNMQYPPPRPPINKTVSKRRGCRCGNATATPGKLTCCGQRCPCYVESKSCIDCKCRGCRNPHRPDGCKIRPVIPELACYEIQIADDSTNLSPTSSSVSIAPTSTTQNFVQQQTHKISSNTPTILSTTSSLTTNNKNCTMEIPLDDYDTSRPNNLIGNVVVASSIHNATSSATTYTTTPTFVMKKPQTVTFTSNHLKRQQQQTQHLQPQTIKLENTSRESLLIKSADGKYQVVNVYTSTPHQTTTNFQRFTTIQNSSGSLQRQTGSIVATKHHIPEISTTLPQILMQPQQNTTILSSTQANTYHHTTNQQQQLITTQQMSVPTTITLSPIIVTSGSSETCTSFPTEIFSEEEIISTHSSTSSSSPLSQPPPLHFATSRHPQLVEVVQAEDI